MATTRFTLTSDAQAVATGACFITVEGVGVEIGFGATPTTFHTITDNMFGYGGDQVVQARLPSNVQDMIVHIVVTVE